MILKREEISKIYIEKLEGMKELIPILSEENLEMEILHELTILCNVLSLSGDTQEERYENMYISVSTLAIFLINLNK